MSTAKTTYRLTKLLIAVGFNADSATRSFSSEVCMQDLYPVSLEGVANLAIFVDGVYAYQTVYCEYDRIRLILLFSP